MANGHSVSSAIEAVSICPRQQYRRPVKDLSFEVASHVRAYLDHQSCMFLSSYTCLLLTRSIDEQAYAFLHSLAASGTSITVPAKPYAGLLAPPSQLALAATLIVYPQITTKARSIDTVKGSDAALKYLRCVHDTVDLSAESLKTYRTAFTFAGSRRRTNVFSPLNTPSSTRVFDVEQLTDVAANAKSLWRCAEDFWHVVGWAFNCSVIHKKRWERWKLWLDIILGFLEAEWDHCTRNGDLLQDTLIWQYICSQEPLAGNTRKRILRAIYATGDAQSLNEFAEVWDKETQDPKPKDTEGRAGLVNFDTGDIGDYASEDEDVEMDGARASVAKGRKTRNASKTSDDILPSLDEAFILDYNAAVTRLGGMDAVNLRQRLILLVILSPLLRLC